MKLFKLFLFCSLVVVMTGGFSMPTVYADTEVEIAEEERTRALEEERTRALEEERTRAARLSADGIVLFDPIEKSIEDIFRAILDIIMVFAIPIVLFFIVWAGFLYVTAAGSQEKISQATKALTYAVVGGVIVLGANVLLAVITNTIRLFT